MNIPDPETTEDRERFWFAFAMAMTMGCASVFRDVFPNTYMLRWLGLMMIGFIAGMSYVIIARHKR